MTVSPPNVGVVKVNDVNYAPNCGYATNQVLSLKAVATNSLYKLGSWGGALSGSANPTTLTMSSSKSVTAYFVFKTNPVTLQGTKSLVDGNKDVFVIDVSSTSNFAASHMLCAKNYVWNSGSNSFSTSITNLSPYKEDDILIYEQNGTNTAAAAGYLAGQGFESLYYMTDGLDDWIAEGYETFTTAEDAANCTNLPPMAYAGADQSVNENQKVTLNGSGSSSGASYAWTQVEGSTVSLSNPAAQNPTFTSPNLNGGDSELIFHLTVTNGGKKDTDSVTVNVRWNNATPTANAGPDLTVGYGSVVTLNGSGSSDPEDSIVSYQWVTTSGTISPSLSNASTVFPSFTAPNRAGWVIYELTVTDNGTPGTNMDRDTVMIRVEEGANTPPAADAGIDQTVTVGQMVTLDGSRSADSDGTIASRMWTQTGGTPTMTLSNLSAIKPTFSVPNDAATTVFTFTLTVTDNEGASNNDTVQVTVNGQKEVPLANIMANGSDGPINIASSDNLSITIELISRGFAGENADWWLVEAEPLGLFHYLPVDGSWAPDLSYSHKGPLFNLGAFEVLNISGLPAGSYTFYFGVDMLMNGSLDMGQTYYDSVTINIQ